MDLQQRIGGKHALEAGREIHWQAGMNVVIEAGESITLKAGGGFITVGPSGVTVSGAHVLINNGGAPGSGSGCSPDPVKLPFEADTAEPGQVSRAPPPVQHPTPSRIAQSRASAADYWRNVEHSAKSFPEAYGARLMGLNAHIGYDIAETVSGVYDTLTDWDKFKAVFQDLPNPREIYEGLQNTAKEIKDLPADQKGEEAYKLLVGGLATAGSGANLVTSTGRQAGKKWGGVREKSFADFPEVASKISRKQYRHIGGRPEHAARGGGYLDSIDDAQAVLDSYKSGSGTIIGKSSQGFPIVRLDTVTGTNVNVGAGIENQATNIFMIKGTAKPSVVPVNPNWKPK